MGKGAKWEPSTSMFFFWVFPVKVPLPIEKVPLLIGNLHYPAEAFLIEQMPYESLSFCVKIARTLPHHFPRFAKDCDTLGTTPFVTSHVGEE